ncbi:hypothetical protein PPERSA_06170 [Pseudocohnilembus persalinus]|uniref:Transmembrane protein n=1 Tax=Pseudocohnilembus persalinus TaxID=266149 RepID=A0A0V0R1G1_PSEPJ|nr:hypothetical protein PPERSA_06170 [Pseudocohnilembus persalinus]|eukprot:KRX07992.1 hypothetical protein PPERSA_06170 [Pseudocohnilembus persalinus]
MDIVDLSLFDSAIQNTGSPGKVIGMTVDCYARFIGEGFPTVYLRVIYVFLTFCIYVMGSIIFFRLFKNKIFKTVQKLTYKPDDEDEDKVNGKNENNVSLKIENLSQYENNDKNIEDQKIKENKNYCIQQSQQKQSPKNSFIINNMNIIQNNKNQQKQQSRYLDDEIIDPSPSYSLLLTKTFIFLFIDIQPSYIQIIIDSISCKQIGEKSYLVNDTTLECDSSVNSLKYKYVGMEAQIEKYFQNQIAQEKQEFKQFQNQVRDTFMKSQDKDSIKNSQDIDKLQIHSQLFLDSTLQEKDEFYLGQKEGNAGLNSLILNSYTSYSDLENDKQECMQKQHNNVNNSINSIEQQQQNLQHNEKLQNNFFSYKSEHMQPIDEDDIKSDLQNIQQAQKTNDHILKQKNYETKKNRVQKVQIQIIKKDTNLDKINS